MATAKTQVNKPRGLMALASFLNVTQISPRTAAGRLFYSYLKSNSNVLYHLEFNINSTAFSSEFLEWVLAEQNHLLKGATRQSVDTWFT